MAEDKFKAGTGTTESDTRDNKTTAPSPNKDLEKSNYTNPAQDNYFIQKASRESAFKWLGRITLVITPVMATAIVGLIIFYLSNLQGPVIRLEEDVKQLQENVRVNTQNINDILKNLYPAKNQNK